MPATAIGLIFFQGTLLVYLSGVFLPSLSAGFRWTRTQLSGATTASQFALALPLWGFAVDHVGPRAVLVASVLVLSGAVASLSLLGNSLVAFYATLAGTSLLAAGASPLGYSACRCAAREFDASALDERADMAKADAAVAASLPGRGLVVNTPDPAPFRARLREAGFYADWKAQHGTAAWAVLEKYAGPLA